MAYYELMIRVPMGQGNWGTDWATAHAGNMSKSAAEGLFDTLQSQHHTCLFRGRDVGRLVLNSGPTAMQPEYSEPYKSRGDSRAIYRAQRQEARMRYVAQAVRSILGEHAEVTY